MNAISKKHLTIIAFFMAIALAMTYPLVTSMQDAVVGRGGDPWQTMWRFEHKENMLKEALSQGKVTELLKEEFFGGGEPRLINISVWPWMDLQLLFGQPFTYNIIYLLTFVLSGYGVFLLVSYLLRNSRLQKQHLMYGAFVAGVFYMLAPYRIAHSAGHFGAMQMQWLPFSILAMFMWLKRPTFGSTIFLAFFLTLQAWTEHHYMLWLGVFGVGLAMYKWKQVQKLILPDRLPFLVLLIFLLTFFVVAPYWPTIQLSGSNPDQLDLGAAQTIRFSANPLSYITPSVEHPIWGDFWQRHVSQKFTGNPAEATQFLGWFPVLFIIFFWRTIKKRQRYWWTAVAALFFVISLGPRLHLLGRVTDIPLLFAFLDNLPVFSAVRTAGRAASMVVLAIAVLLGLGIAKHIHRYSTVALIVGIIVLEFLFFPVNLQSTQTAQVYKELNDISGTSVIEVPAAKDYSVSSKSLYASLGHDKDILGSVALERGMDTSELNTLKAMPAIRQLLYLETATLDKRRQEFFQQDLVETFYDTTRYLNIGAIIIHTDVILEKHVKSYRDWLENEVGLTPKKIESALLYELSGLPQGDDVFLARREGWHNVTYDEDQDITLALIKRKATIEVFNGSDTTKTITLSWQVSPDTPGKVEFRNNQKIDTAIIDEVQTVNFELSPGRHTYTFVNQTKHDLVLQGFLMEVE